MAYLHEEEIVHFRDSRIITTMWGSAVKVFFTPKELGPRTPFKGNLVTSVNDENESLVWGLQCWAYVKPRTVCSFLAFTRPKRNTPFLGHVGAKLGLRWVYVCTCTYLWVPIFHLGSPRKTDPTKCQVSFGKLRFFGGLGGVRFIHFEGAKQSGKFPPLSLSASFTAVFFLGWFRPGTK